MTMTKRLAILLLLLCHATAWSETHYPGLQVDVNRDGRLYTFNASFATSLSKCAAYHYLTDYEGAKNLPGVIDSTATRLSGSKVRVERSADESILFFSVRLQSVMEYTEKPFDTIAFTQLSGDSKIFQGNWQIEANSQGSTLRFKGLWEPDSLIPFFVIDHFARNGLIEKFSAIARLAESRKESLPNSCSS